jgi:hypothetical protein
VLRGETIPMKMDDLTDDPGLAEQATVNFVAGFHPVGQRVEKAPLSQDRPIAVDQRLSSGVPGA